MIKKILSAMLLVGLISGCSSTVNKEKVEAVNSVAVAGFSVYKNSASDGLIQMGKTFSESEEFTNTLASDFYSTFTATYTNKLNVKVLSKEDLLANAYYRSLVQKYGDVSKTILSIGKSYRAPGMLSGQAIFDMTPEERAKLARELGVDSIVGLEAMLYQGGSSGLTFLGVGAGSLEIKYRVTLTNYNQYDQSGAEPIVEFTNLVGKLPEEGDKSFVLAGETFSSPSQRALVAAVRVVTEDLAQKMK